MRGDDTTSLALTGDAARDLLRILMDKLPADALVRALVDVVPMEEKRAAYKELLYETGTLTPEQAGALVHWTGPGFIRRANQENTPYVKLGKKQPRNYHFADIDAMLKALRIWPHGRPQALHVMEEHAA
jgi:hypothetical protein